MHACTYPTVGRGWLNDDDDDDDKGKMKEKVKKRKSSFSHPFRYMMVNWQQSS